MMMMLRGGRGERFVFWADAVSEVYTWLSYGVYDGDVTWWEEERGCCYLGDVIA